MSCLWQEWFTVLEHFHRLNATVSDLVMGNVYTFRVFAENKVGRSETAAVTKDAAHIQKTGEVSTCYCFIPTALQTSPIKLTWFLKKSKRKQLFIHYMA